MNLQRKTRQIQRGDIYCADLSPVVGSEQGGNRPVLVIQNNTGNHFSPTVIAAAITGHTKRDRPVSYTHLDVYKRQLCGRNIRRSSSGLENIWEPVKRYRRRRYGNHLSSQRGETCLR